MWLPSKFIINDNSKVLGGVGFRNGLVVNFVLEDGWPNLVGNFEELTFSGVEFHLPGFFPDLKGV